MMWLWHRQDFISFDYGHRVEGFRDLSGEAEQEGGSALAWRAVQEVVRYRELFVDIGTAAAILDLAPSKSLWSHYHAAMSIALAGDLQRARCRFDALAHAAAGNRDWVRDLQARAARLAELCADESAFRVLARQDLDETRALLRLPPYDGEIS